MAGVPSRDCQGNWGIPGYLDKGGGGRFQYFYCMAGVPSWDCQGNWGIPGYLDKGGGEVPVLLLYGRSTVLGLSG